jgi:sirohydrochlorin ferrochelatase
VTTVGSLAATATGEPVLLVAHGSGDPRAAVATRALAGAVAEARPGLVVRASYLDHAGPRPGEVLRELAAAGHPATIVVPLLLTAAYHGRVDLPQVIADARAEGLRMRVRVTDVLGPVGGVVPEPLLAGLGRRLGEALGGSLRPADAFDAVVLAAAGTRDAVARGTVEEAATAFGALLGVPCLAAYASAASPTAGEAVLRLRGGGARRVAVAAYFLAPGRLYETATASARDVGVVAVAAPLAGAAEIAELVLSRLSTGS